MKRTVSVIPAVLGAAVLLAALQATTPPYATLTGPISTVGRQSETVSSNTFSVKVNRVLKANNIAYEQFGRAIDLKSSGVWVVVSADLQAFQETMPVCAATLIGASGLIVAPPIQIVAQQPSPARIVRSGEGLKSSAFVRFARLWRILADNQRHAWREDRPTAVLE